MIIIGWIGILTYSNTNTVEAENESTNTIEKPVEDPNLINKKPTPRWRLNANGFSQRYIELTSEGRENRMRELLSHYDKAPEYEVRQVVARIYRVYPEALICIAYADTSLGNFLKTPNNIGNVWNNDRWNKVIHWTAEAGVNAIGKVLTNRYLWQYTERKQLAGSSNPDWPNYATELTDWVRTNNWYNNTLNCIGMIRDKWVPDNFAFRW